jgi:hypothetical protein
MVGGIYKNVLTKSIYFEKALKIENWQKITVEVILRKTLVLGNAKENYIKENFMTSKHSFVTHFSIYHVEVVLSK